MARPGIEELLIRSILDPQLLQRLRTSPESAFDDYDLNDRAKEILSSPDERLLELLGEAVGQQTEEGPLEDMPAQDQAAIAAPAQPAVASTSLPASRLAVRLVPYVQQATDDASAVVVNYAGHLDPMPEGVELDDLPSVPAGLTDGEQLLPVAVAVAIQPIVWTDEAGNRQITFSVSAQLPQDTATAASDDAAAARLSPWPHDVDSPGVKAAAARVHEAEESDRYDRLRELIDVMVAAPTPGGSR